MKKVGESVRECAKWRRVAGSGESSKWREGNLAKIVAGTVHHSYNIITTTLTIAIELM
jgi:hypothetical protein